MSGSGDFALPTGTVAFLLTDVEGSTRSWEADPDAMASAMDRHNELLDEIVARYGGVSPPAQGEGDSIVAAFPRASDAVQAAREAQRSLSAEPWPTTEPLRVRMAVHAGEARFVEDGNYAGQAIIRTARLRAIAQGGQVLVSASAHDLTIDQLGAEVSFIDLGEHRLRDLARPERVWQLVGGGLPDDFEPLRSLDSHPHNLPVQLSSFVGRVAETATLVRLVRSDRLVTIVGAGGAGKTRLSQQVAAEVLDQFAEGAWWIELAELTDAGELPGAIARAVGVKAEAEGEGLEALASRLGGARLLVLDNCEHIIDGTAQTVHQLLRRCPDLRVLATSREPLAIDGEVAWRIPPLGVPNRSDDPASSEALASLSQYDSVRLFLDRATRVRPNFRLDEQTGPAVADICHRLDGVPLAIELAAARCRSLGVDQIREGLTNSFSLLTGSSRSVVPRQQTLEASIAWSHDLLTVDEQVLLRRLAVFRGGCTLSEAEAIVADDALARSKILDLLDRLVAQSLLVADDEQHDDRYRLLETVREFAARRLAEAGEEGALSERHAAHFAATVLEVGPRLETAYDPADYRWVSSALDNIDATLRHLDGLGHVDTMVSIVEHVALIWGFVDPPRGERVITRVLDSRNLDDGQRARVLTSRAQLRSWAGDIIACLADAAAAAELADAVGDRWIANRARFYYSQVMVWVDPIAGVQMQAEVAAVAHELGDLLTETTSLIGLGGAQIGILTHRSTGRATLAEGGRLTEQLANPVASSWYWSQRALDAAYGGQLDEAERWSDEAIRLLAVVGEALGVGGLRLSQGTIIGGVAMFSRAYALGCRGEPSTFVESLPEMARAAGAAGYFLTPALLELNYAVSRCHTGDLAAADAAFARCRAANELAGTEATLVNAAPYWADLALVEGDVVEARRRLDTVADSLVSVHSVHARSRLALRLAAIALIEHEPGEAERQAHEALALAAAEDLAWETLHALELLAQVAAATDSHVEAARLAGAVARIRMDTGIGLRLAWHGDHFDAALTSAVESLGPDEYQAAWDQGHALDTFEAIAYVTRTRGERKRPNFGWDALTPTEHAVVAHISAGLTNRQVGAAMFVSPETIKTHLSHVFTKLGVSTRSELAAVATRRNGLNPGAPSQPSTTRTPTTEPKPGATP
jgi:predicted ATPase/class 3 adenylate cyclase/DNA-binding CsgD family transcriptional regulator